MGQDREARARRDADLTAKVDESIRTLPRIWTERFDADIGRDKRWEDGLLLKEGGIVVLIVFLVLVRHALA